MCVYPSWYDLHFGVFAKEECISRCSELRLWDTPYACVNSCQWTWQIQITAKTVQSAIASICSDDGVREIEENRWRFGTLKPPAVLLKSMQGRLTDPGITGISRLGEPVPFKSSASGPQRLNVSKISTPALSIY